jgi:glycosyltransferase involved in cell wall biosynthesis
MFVPTISVVIPALNEERNLPVFLSRIPRWVHEVVLVDGNSTDNTIAVARKLSDKVIIVRQTRRGKGDALRCGFAAATGDIIVTLDADGSTDPAEIPVLIAPLLCGWQFTKASRFMQGGGSADITLYRLLGNKGLQFLVRLLFGGHYSDFNYGYNAYWAWTLDYTLPDVDGFEIEALMTIRALRAGLKIAEVPSFELPRAHGQSHLKVIRDGTRILKIILKERFGGRPIPLAYFPSQRIKNLATPAKQAIRAPVSPAEGSKKKKTDFRKYPTP